MSQFVLIHGASHGGWCWHKVKKLLEEGAHTVQAPDLPGHEPQSILPISAPLRRSPGRSVRRIGVVCQRDRALTPDFQEKMYRRAGCEIRYLDSGHAPFFSRPRELVDILDEE